MVWMAPVLKDNMAFLSCEQTQTSGGHPVTASSVTIRATRFIGAGEADLENTSVVHVFQGEGEALRQHSVEPAFQDGGDAEPVQRELHTSVRAFVVAESWVGGLQRHL